ncbi:GvpL/GvpF family gas vesicle protein [Streptomyces sp. NPDC002004]
MSDLVTYVYAVARGAEGLEQFVAALDGVADAPVHLVSATGDDDVVLVASRVPAEDFHEEALRRHLEDLGWLEAVARAHNAVVEAVAGRTTALPLRLATVYLDDARARDVLDTGRARFAEHLARLDDHVEWGVKIYVEPSTAPAPSGAPPAPGLSPGRAYLRGRKQQQHARDAVYGAAEQAAARVEEAGRRYAADRARHRVQQGVLAGGPAENVVNDAYLVPRERGEDFRAAVANAADGLDGVRVEVTGPWAPYSFAVAQPGADGTAEGATP